MITMTMNQFLGDFIDPWCWKQTQDKEEYKERVAAPNCVCVRAPFLYDLYKAITGDNDMDRGEFYQTMKLYFYYDKYECTHGTEYYYYIMFNENNETYQIIQPLLTLFINSFAPVTLTDVRRKYEAV